MKIPAIVIAIVSLLTCACRTQNWCDFHVDEPQDLINLLADTSGYYNPPVALLAHDRLLSMGTNAFPTLIRNLSDNRPTYGCFQLQSMDRTTVGDVCFGVIIQQVEYGSYHKFGPDYVTRDNVEDWWENRKGKTLDELQIEALEWTIEKVETDEAFRWRKEQSTGINTLPMMKDSLRALKNARPSKVSDAPSDVAPGAVSSANED